jgi:hypothetical protein
MSTSQRCFSLAVFSYAIAHVKALNEEALKGLGNSLIFLLPPLHAAVSYPALR